VQYSKLGGEISLKLAVIMFGANTLARLSVKRHADLFRVIAAGFGPSEVEAYFKHMKGLFENPQVEETFG
jgi:hypothetical protein